MEEIRHRKRRGNKSLHFNLAGDIRRCAFECRDKIPGFYFHLPPFRRRRHKT